MKKDFLSRINMSFSGKVLISVVGLLILSNVTMNLFYLLSQQENYTEEIDRDGRLLASVLAQNAKLGIFAGDSQQLSTNLQTIFTIEGIIGGCVYDTQGEILAQKVEQGWKEEAICKIHPPRHADFPIPSEDTSAVLRREEQRTIEFWHPVIAGPREFSEEALFYSSEATLRPSLTRTIGFVGIVFDKEPIQESINAILFKNLIILSLFLIIGFIAAYYIIQGFSRPLNLMIANIKKHGLEVGKKDELGMLADTYSGMINTISDSFETINALKKGLEIKVDELELEIDKRKKIEVDLRESEDKFRTISENIADGVAIIYNNKFVWFNKAFGSIFGYEKNHLALDPEILLPHSGHIQKHNPGSDGTSRYIVEAKKNNSTPLLLEVSAQKIMYERQESIQVIVRDITKMVAAERKRKELEVKALSQSKLASLGKIATSVAHEINQPLSFIKIALESFLQDSKNQSLDQEDMETTCRESLHQVDRISMITNHLRNFGRKDTTMLTNVNMADILTNSLTLMRERLRLSDILLVQDIDEELPPVFGNSIKLEQVFINLFQNSVDALTDSHEKQIMITMQKNGPMVEIIFSDSGPGIPPDVRENIFEPFFTTKMLEDRSGLGLGIVNNIIKEHDGTIEYQQKEGLGASFLISLPAV